MHLKEFFLNYPLKELNIIKAVLKNNTLFLDVEMEVYLEYIANGLRSDFDLNPVHRFIFSSQHNDFTLQEPIIVNDYRFENDSIHLTINNIDLKISEDQVICISNYR